MIIYDTGTLEILSVNKSAVKKYGFTRSEFKQITIEDIRPPEDLPKLRKQLDRVNARTKTRHAGTFRHRTKEGEIIYVQITSQAFEMEQRDVRIVHIHDVTETVVLKNKVEDSFRDQRHHIENNPLAMVKYDENFRIIEWSRRAVEKTGYSKDEVLGTTLFELDLFGDSQVDGINKRIKDIVDDGKSKDRFETVIRLKNGNTMEVMVHASALHDKEGKLKSVLAFIENISERKHYERQLQKRERKYHRLFEDANDGIFLMKDLKFVDCNESIAQIFGGPKEKILGNTPMDFSPELQPDGQRSAKKAKQKIRKAQNGNPQVFEWKHLNFDNEPIEVEVSLNTIEIGDEEYVQAILRDLTEHKKIKNELESERQRLERAQNLARLGSWTYDVQRDKAVWSDILYEIIGIERENFETELNSVYNYIHPEDTSKFDHIIQKLHNTSDTIDYHLRMINGKGQQTCLKCRAKGEFDAEGNLIQITGISQDVTEQKKAAADLKRSKELFESLFLDSPVAIAMIDTEGQIQKINRSFEILFEYHQQELIGEDLLRHILPEDRYDEIGEIYNELFKKEGESYYFEDQRVTKEGTVKDLLVGALPVVLDGEVIAAFGIYIDISMLRETQKHLKESLKEKEILLSEVHHRVKNNLAIISGLLELESMKWDDKREVQNVLNESMLRIKSMAMVHEQLYKSEDFANLEFDNYVQALVELISDTINVKDKEISLRVESDDVEMSINQAIPCALIVNELVTNAFEHGFEGCREGKLEVLLKRQGDMARIVVSDDGRGLPDDFDINQTNSLGLTMVQQLTKQLEGDLEIDAENGTYFEVKFSLSRKSGSGSHHFV